MPLTAQAFLAIWHDIDPAMEAEWHRWHTFEHMPERLGIPGFLAGRRYMNPSAASQSCFTLYEGRDVDVFNSPDYLARLNAPTPWTRKMAPAFRNFMRGACRCTASHGQGYGGAVMALRFNKSEHDEPLPKIDTSALIAGTSIAPGVVGVHTGICEQDVTRVETNERKMRSATGESRYDAVIIVEGWDHETLASQRPALIDIATGSVRGYELYHAEVYSLTYLLRSD